MIKDPENCSTSAPKVKSCIIINQDKVLDPIITSRAPTQDDLVVQQVDEGISYVLQDGKLFVNYLDKLINDHGYSLVFYSNRKENQLLHILNLLNQACQREGFKEFPKATAIFVKEPHIYRGVRASDPVVILDRPHNVLIAGYGSQFGEEIDILDGFSKVFHISNGEHKNHTIIDKNPVLAESAAKKAWNAYDTSSTSLKEILERVYRKVLASEKEKSEEKPKETTHKPDELWNEPLISTRKFFITADKVPGGSSLSRAWYEDEDGNKWFGKCSYREFLEGSNEDNTYQASNFEDYKECLAIRIYGLFGVTIPQVTLSKQYLNEALKKLIPKSKDSKKPRLHTMSRKVEGFEVLGKTFINNYKKDSLTETCMDVEGKGRLLLKGYGRVLVISVLIHDFDCLGNSGGNMGYIIKKNSDGSEYAHLVKIDAGEALSFAQDMSKAQSLANEASSRTALLGTGGQKIEFNQLTKADREEFIAAAKDILEFPDNKLRELFEPFLKLDKKFGIILETLLRRKQNLLASFTPEVEELLRTNIIKLEEEQAEEAMQTWGKTESSTAGLETKEKTKLVLDKAQLEAYRLATLSSEGFKHYQVPQQNQMFVGRDAELTKMREFFIENSNIAGCAIVGGAGLGKSQIAIEYISRNHREFYSRVVWLHAEMSDLIIGQMQIYLETCFKIEFDPQDKDKNATILNTFYQKLSEECGTTQKKVCIILDSPESMLKISGFLPSLTNYPQLMADIVVTSRYTKWEDPFLLVIDLQHFGVAETRTFIMKYYQVEGEMDEKFKGLDRLTDLLGGLPLAICQAVAYIQQSGISVAKYCELFVNSQQEQFSDSKEETAVNERAETEGVKGNTLKAVTITLTLALADLRAKSQDIESILDVLAYLASENISYKILQDCWKHFYEYWVKKKQENSENMKQELKQQFQKALELLIANSIVSWSGSLQEIAEKVDENVESDGGKLGMVQVHQLTQLVIRINHEKSGIYEDYCKRVFHWLVIGFNRDYTNQDKAEMAQAAQLVPHVVNLEKLQKNSDENKDALLDLIGSYYLEGAGNYEAAVKYYQKSLDLKEKSLKLNGICHGKEEVLIAATLRQLGKAYGELGQYEKMKDYLTRALEFAERNIDHQLTASIYMHLGNVWGDIGDYEKKRDYLTLALKFVKQHAPGNLVIAAQITANLANVWGSFGDFEMKKNLLAEVLEIIEKQYGKDHVQTATVLENLGNAWGELGNYEKKRECTARAVEIMEDYYGKEHISTATVLTSLGNALGMLGHEKEHLEVLARVVGIYEKHYGKDHVQTAQQYANLGTVLGALGDHEKKKDLLTSALEIIEKHYGKEHPMTAITLTNLGNAWGALGNPTKRIEYITHVVNIYEKFYGKDHIKTAKTLIDLGNAWGSLGDYQKQKEYLTRSLETVEKQYGPEHMETAVILGNLGNAYGFLGDLEKRKDLLTRSLEIFETNYAGDLLRIGATLTNLGNAWGDLGDHEKKKDYLTRAVAIKTDLYGKSHVSTASTLSSLGNAWGSLGDYAKKKECLTQALEAYENYYGPVHLQTGALLTNLASALSKFGECEKEKELLMRALAIYESHYGVGHLHTSSLLVNIAYACFRLNDFETALNYQARAHQIFLESYGENNEYTIDSADFIKQITEAMAASDAQNNSTATA